MKRCLRLKNQLFLIPLLMVLTMFSANYAKAQYIMSDQVLYANGYENYKNRNWPYAIIYLFAYQQRNTLALQQKEGFKKQLTDAYDFSMRQLAQERDELERLREAARAKENKNGAGNSQQGLEQTPPPIPAPVVVEGYKRPVKQ